MQPESDMPTKNLAGAVDTATAGISPAAIRQELKCIQSSTAFANSRKVSDFLGYVVEARLKGDSTDLRETSIALALYERDSSYDPKIDSIVRTQARRVRDRLDEYYKTEGIGDPILIRLPKGGYEPVFELSTTPVMEGPTPPEAEATPAISLARPEVNWLFWIILVLIALSIGFIAWWHRSRAAKVETKPDSHVARVLVMRFKSHSSGPEDELYGRAMADAAVSWLARMNQLSIVTPPESDSSEANRESDMEVARAAESRLCGLRRILEGGAGVQATCLREGKEDRFGSSSRTYTFSWPNLVHIEDDMGEVVSHGLAERLGLRQVPGLSNVSAATPAAYQAYLDGHTAATMARQTFELEALQTSVRSLKRALELDPNYADALADLGRMQLLLALPKTNENGAMIAEAEGYARRALTVAPRHVASHVVLATAAIMRFRPLEGLEFSKRAVDLDSSYIPALESLAEAYEALGYYESATQMNARLLQLEPVEMDAYLFGGRLQAKLGHFDEAAACVRAFSRVNVSSPHIPFIESEILLAKGDYLAAEEKLKTLRELMTARLRDKSKAYLYSYIDRELALAQVRQGREAFARQTLARFGAVFSCRVDTPILLAAALGMPREAIRNIEVNPYYQNYRYLVTEPWLKPLYGEQAFQELLDKSYIDWVRGLEEVRDSLPAQPPKLPSPGEFLAANGIRVSR